MVVETDEQMDENGKHFDLLMNAAGDVMLVFSAMQNAPVNPIFVYDGRNKAILYKNKTDIMPVYPIPKEAESEMKRARDILCVEIKDNKIVAEYNAKVEVRR